MKECKPVRQVKGGHQAQVSHQNKQVYLGTYATAAEALFAHHAAKAILGLAVDVEAPIPEPENADAIRQKVKVRLEAHARRPGRHHRSQALMRRDNVVGLKGVSLVAKPWRANISKDRRRFSLGSFATPFEAATAYNLAAELLNGPSFAPNPIPPSEQLSAARVEAIRRRVVEHLGVVVPTSTEL